MSAKLRSGSSTFPSVNVSRSPGISGSALRAEMFTEGMYYGSKTVVVPALVSFLASVKFAAKFSSLGSVLELSQKSPASGVLLPAKTPPDFNINCGTSDGIRIQSAGILSS